MARRVEQQIQQERIALRSRMQAYKAEVQADVAQMTEKWLAEDGGFRAKMLDHAARQLGYKLAEYANSAAAEVARLHNDMLAKAKSGYQLERRTDFGFDDLRETVIQSVRIEAFKWHVASAGLARQVPWS